MEPTIPKSENDDGADAQGGSPQGTIQDISSREPSTVILPHVDKFGSGLFSVFQRSAGTVFLLLIVIAVPVTMILLSKEQDIRQHASFTPSVAPTPVKYDISGAVYEDTNNNGKHDSWEIGPKNTKILISGQNVKLETVTDSFGDYDFNQYGGLLPGSYILNLVVPSGYAANTSSSVSIRVGPSAVVDFGLKKSLSKSTPAI